MAELVRATVASADGGFEDHIEAAASPSAEIAWTLAQRLAASTDIPEGASLARCWTWIAASLGCRPAMRMLARHIADEAVRGQPLLPAYELMPMVSDWLRRADGGPAPAAPAASVARVTGGFSAPARRRPNPSMLAGASDTLLEALAAVGVGVDGPDASPTEAPGRIVVPRVGDPGSLQGSEITRRFAAVVGRPLPFKGHIPDLRSLADELEDRWPWAGNLARWVEGQFALILSGGGAHPRLPNLVLVGPYGCGKTTILEWLAARCGVPCATVNVGGTSDSGGLAAVPRGWQTAQPSLPVRVFADSGCCNPCIVIDEMEKGVGDLSNRNGSAMGTLLAMTDLSAGGYSDSCLMASVDLSQVTWLATVNSLAPLSPALRSRFLPQVVPPPEPAHFDRILPGVVESAARKLNVAPEFMPFISRTDRAWMRSVFEGSGCSIRQLQQAYGVVSGERARQEARAMQLPN